MRVWVGQHGLRLLISRSGMAHHLPLKSTPHGLLYLLEEDLGNATAQSVDRVQEPALDRVEQRLEHVVLERELRRQRRNVRSPASCCRKTIL